MGLPACHAQSSMDGVRILRPFLGIAERTSRRHLRRRRFAIHFRSRQRLAKIRARQIAPRDAIARSRRIYDRAADRSRRARGRSAGRARSCRHPCLSRVASKRDDAGVIHIDLEHLRSAPRAIACGRSDDLPANHSSRRLRAGICFAGRACSMRLCEDGAMPACTLHGCAHQQERNACFRSCANMRRSRMLPIKPGESSFVGSTLARDAVGRCERQFCHSSAWQSDL